MSIEQKNENKADLENKGNEQDMDHFKERLAFSRVENASAKAGISWRAHEYEFYEKSNLWYLFAGIFILGIAAYCVYTNSPIPAITFILIGVVGYMHLQKEPEIIDFAINYKGVRAGREIYDFDSIKSFWIFYDPPHTKTLSLHTDAIMMPYIHIPIEDEDPVKIREIMMEFVPEIKQNPSLIDALSRFLHI